MDQAITVGGVLIFAAIVVGVIGICGLALFVLSAIAEGFKH